MGEYALCQVIQYMTCWVKPNRLMSQTISSICYNVKLKASTCIYNDSINIKIKELWIKETFAKENNLITL